MFLATTALDGFWIKDEKILFTGEWCKLYNKKKKYENLEFITFPYQWDNLSDMDLAIQEIDLTYKKTIDSLTATLNEYLNIKQDNRYYSIILGHWLTRFLHTNYDKFLLLNLIIDKYGEKLHTLVLGESGYIIPLDEKDYGALVSEDYYNLQEYSRIIEFLNINFQYKTIQDSPSQKTLFKSKRKIKKSIFFYLLNLFKNKKICISSPYFIEMKSYLMLSLKSKNIIFNDFNYDIDIEMEIDTKFRKNDLTIENPTEFELYLSKNLLQFIPMLFLEGHNELQQALNAKNIFKSSIYYNANAIQVNDIYKFFLASIHNNIRIITHQHGAGYGVDFECFEEKYERSVSDKYFTFGWSDGASTSYLPAEKLNIKPHIKKKRKNTLLILTMGTRYLGRLYYMPSSSQLIENTVNSTVRFLNLVKDNSIKVRFYPYDEGWLIKQRIYDKTAKFQESKDTFDNEFKNANLIISEHLGTTFYEAVAANKPILIFINRDIYKFRKDADKYFIQLHRVGIIHFSEKSCADFYLNIKNNIDDWWLSEEVQIIRKEFAYNFARKSENWTKEFVDLLDRELDFARR